MLKKIGKFILDVITVFIIVYITIIGYSYVSINVLKKNYVGIFGYTFFEVASGSMNPAIKVGDIVVVKLNSPYQKGDVITYYSEPNYITHRVYEVNGDNIITKGDANNTVDFKVSKENVLGKVVIVLKSVYIFKKVILNVRVVASFIITVILFILVISYKNVDKIKKFRMRRIHYKKEVKVRKKRTKKSINNKNPVSKKGKRK